jgi:hypothetical protein
MISCKVKLAPRLKTKALLLMSVDPLVSMVLLMSMDSCERTVETVETVEFADVLPSVNAFLVVFLRG